MSESAAREGLHVRIDVRGVARIRLDDGKAVNVLSRARLGALARCLEGLSGARRPRALLLVGNGIGSFAAGANLREISKLDAREAEVLSREGGRVMRLLAQGPWPTGAFVDGHALGGGCDLALACDVVASTPRSVFGHPGITRGFFTGWGGTARIPGGAAHSGARALFLEGERVAARRLLDAGLLSLLGAPRPTLARLETWLLRLAGWPAAARDAWRLGSNQKLDSALSRLAAVR